MKLFAGTCRYNISEALLRERCKGQSIIKSYFLFQSEEKNSLKSLIFQCETIFLTFSISVRYKNLMGTISQLFPNFKTVPKETECTRTNGNKCRSTQVMKRKVLCRRGADSSTCLFLPLLENDEIGMFTKASKVFFLRVHGI